MKTIRLINIEWNNYNGFVFEFIEIELNNFDGTLLGLNFAKDMFNFDILFFHFEVKSPIY